MDDDSDSVGAVGAVGSGGGGSPPPAAPPPAPAPAPAPGTSDAGQAAASSSATQAPASGATPAPASQNTQDSSSLTPAAAAGLAKQPPQAHQKSTSDGTTTATAAADPNTTSPSAPADAKTTSSGQPLPKDVEDYIDNKLPTQLNSNGHALSKHGPDEVQKGIDGLKNGKGAPSSNFNSLDSANDVVKNAPDALKDVLRNDPQKLQEFKDFMANGGDKAQFGFQYDTGKNIGSGYAKDASGQLLKSSDVTRASVTYNKSGGVVQGVKSAYPVYDPSTAKAVPAGVNPGDPQAAPETAPPESQAAPEAAPAAPEAAPKAGGEPTVPEIPGGSATEGALETAARYGSKGLEVAGKVALPLAAAASIYDIATSNDKPREIATQAGGWAGGLAGAEGGAAAGAAIGSIFPGAGTVIGGVAGGLIGGIAGSLAGSHLSSWLYSSIFGK